MDAIPLHNTTGRGRNRWFRARQALLLAHTEGVDLDVVSSRPTIPGPVRLELSPPDALALARGLIDAAVQTGAGFVDADAATSLRDAFLQALGTSTWLEAPERAVIGREMAAIKELLSLSGDT